MFVTNEFTLILVERMYFMIFSIDFACVMIYSSRRTFWLALRVVWVIFYFLLQ